MPSPGITEVYIVGLADQRLLGNVSGGTAAAAQLTQAQVRTFLGLGTLALVTPTGTPNGAKFLRDDYAWTTIDLSPYVPYTGATTDLNMGVHGVTATSIQATDSIHLGGVSDDVHLVSGSSNYMTFANGIGGSTLLLQLNGTTNARPAIKQTGTTVAFRLADDSADAPITCAALTASGTVSSITGSSTANFIAGVTGVTAKSTFRTVSGGGSDGQFFTGANESSEAVRFDTSKPSIGVTYDNRNGIHQVNYHAFTLGGVGTYPITLQMIAAGGIPVGINILSGGRYCFSSSATITYSNTDASIGLDSTGVVGFYTTGTGSTKAAITAGAATFSAKVESSSTFIPGSFTVATLPSTSAAGRVTGARATVTDSNATITAGIGAVVAGGGTDVVCVMWDGTNWRIA